jgi:hypothetical protein
MKILKFVLPIIIPSILVGLCFLPCDSKLQNLLLTIVSAVGTFGALLFLIIDKIEKEKEEKVVFWHEHLPYLTVGSPCDPTQNRCEINLLTNIDDISNRGCILFSITNFSTANAYDVTIKISTSPDFEQNQARYHFIDMVPIIQYTNENWYNNIHYIYSKYHINPQTKDVLLDEFDLCNFTNNCDTKRGLKTIYIRLEYWSTPAKYISKKIINDFKVELECGETDSIRQIMINNILRVNYQVSL